MCVICISSNFLLYVLYTEYEVVTATGNFRRAGTNANVYITIFSDIVLVVE